MLCKPCDGVIGLDVPNSATTVLDFWRWAFSDLCDDALKGTYAEWLVGLLLDIPMRRCISWANSDLKTPAGVTVEVKSSAYWQSIKLYDTDGKPKSVEIASEDTVKRIRFGGLKARDGLIQNSSKPADYKSDLYIFAFQKERDSTLWNALDLSQWEFYLLKRKDLADRGCKSISLVELRKLCKPMSAAELREKGRAALRELAALKQEKSVTASA